MTAPIIIALTGLAGAGKDSVADVLATHAGFTKLAFADALRNEIAAGFNLGDSYGLLRDRTTKERAMYSLALAQCRDAEFVRRACVARNWQPTKDVLDAPRAPRTIMQLWGTEYRRQQRHDYWTTLVALQIDSLAHDGQSRFVVSDCRFGNEAEELRTRGGEVWQIKRPGLHKTDDSHVSETDGDKFAPEALIINNGSMTDLAWRTLRCLQARHGGLVLPDDLQQDTAP